MADDAFGLKSPNNPKAYTPPPGLEAVHREGNTWAIQGDRSENTSHIEVNQWNYMIALWRGLTFVEGVDLSDLNSGDPMLLKEIVVRSIDAVGGPYLTGAAAAASTATTKAGEASDSADIAVGAAGTATTKAGEAAGSADTAVGAAGTATTKAAEALASANAVGVARVAVETARDATLAAFDQFDDRMLGDFATAPATDNDGDPLQRGALYFDTTLEIMRVWTGSVWGAAYVSSEGVLMAANNLSDIADEAIARANIGLGNVDNTADVDKPISSATQTALNGKAADSHTHTAATSGSAGFMSAEDKSKMDGIAVGANATPALSDADVIAGTGTTKGAVSSTQIKAATEAHAQSLGIGQTWQDLTASRAAGTSYQNTTARPIMVAISTSSSSSRNVEISADGVTWLLIGRVGTTSMSNTFIVPVNWHYRIDGTVSTLYGWLELR